MQQKHTPMSEELNSFLTTCMQSCMPVAFKYITTKAVMFYHFKYFLALQSYNLKSYAIPFKSKLVMCFS